jgi:hypothetical protein
VDYESIKSNFYQDANHVIQKIKVEREIDEQKAWMVSSYLFPDTVSEMDAFLDLREKIMLKMIQIKQEIEKEKGRLSTYQQTATPPLVSHLPTTPLGPTVNPPCLVGFGSVNRRYDVQHSGLGTLFGALENQLRKQTRLLFQNPRGTRYGFN